MERDDMNKKDGGVGRGLVDYKAKGPWDYRARFLAEDTLSSGLVGGFSWPPRSYTCSFCKRDFRSAQALGGHMNVHRRDRARLRQSPPWVPQISSNPNPNPDDTNPNSSTSNPAKPPPITCALPTSHSPPPPTQARFVPSSSSPSSATHEVRISESADDGLMRKQTLKEFFTVGKLKDFVVDKDHDDVLRRREIISLDLEIGLCRDSTDDLDLELRLGYA